MGNSEEDTSAKTPKSSPKQEQSTPNGPPTVFPDWASFQAYYNSAGTAPIPAPAFYPSPVASNPQGHPYVWAPQHIMPPYGTPPPYVALYPPGALYPHPTIPPGSFPYSPYAMTSPTRTNDASVGVAGGAEVDGKNNGTKASGASVNGVASHSGESGSEASSEGSDANSENGMQQERCHEKNMASGESKNVDAAASEAGGASQATQSSTVSSHISPIMAIPPTAITAPSTTLNIGMDYWGGPSPASVNSFRSKLPITPCPAAVVSARDAVPSDLSLQDEREIKRQKRKQSNRESARRSRLRKQAECEDLAHRASSLNEENDRLREELARIKEECEKLASENASLTEKLKKFQGEESGAHDACRHPDSNS